MKKQSARILLTIACITAAALGYADRLNGQDISNEELIKSAQAAARGQASQQQKAILFANNERLNNLAMAGKISGDDYQHNQRAFVEQNEELIRRASTKNGLVVAPPKDTPVYKAGTDTDRQLINRTGNLTVDHVKNVRGSYNQEVSEYLKSQGVNVAPGENWAKKLATDIMPSPYDMKPADFKAANSYINSSGGLAYTSATAAKIQLDLDGKQLQTPSLYEANEFHNEMQKKINVMNAEVQKFNRERNATTDPVKQEDLDIEIRKRTAFMSKYIARDNTIADLINKGSDSSGPVETSYERSATSKIKQAQNRDAAKATLEAEAHVSALNEHLAGKATRKFNDAIAGAAVAGNNAGAAQGVIAGNLKNLSPTQQSQAISDLEIKYGKDFARGVAGELKTRSASPAKPVSGGNVTVSKSLGLVSAIVNIGSQYAQGKKTTEILWNMSIGGTLENVNAETANYTRREIERLKDKYRLSGEDPDSTMVKLKIMAEATVKGTFYGSAIGSYDLLKSATHTVAGATVAVADSAVFLVGEALDTRNVLETTYAEIKAQNMTQSVQDARAVKFARDALAELKRLNGEAAYLKSILEQNTRSARQFCRNCDSSLDDLREDLRVINSLEGADSLKTLPEREKRLSSNLLDSLNSLQTMNRQAQTTARAFLAAGDKKDVMQVIQVLEPGFNQHAAALEKYESEMLKIGEMGTLNGVADMLAAFAARREALLEQSRQASANAVTMRENEARYKKTVAAFVSLKERVLNAETFFAGKRETNEGDWMILKSKINAVTRPDGNVPEGFFAEVGTLERLPDKIRSESGRLQPGIGASPDDLAKIGALADAALQRLVTQYNAAGGELGTLRANLDNLRAMLNKAPEPVTAQPVVAGLNCPSSGVAGQAVSMSVTLPAAGGGSVPAGSGKIDPFDGHDPDSPEGMLALQRYAAAAKAGKIPVSGTNSPGNAQSAGYLILWDFGDGTSTGKGSSASVNHTFQQPGRYTIKVTVFSTLDKSRALAVNSTQINIQSGATPPQKPQVTAPPAGNQRLPCGHFPGQCPKDGIASLKCRLHSGKISERKN